MGMMQVPQPFGSVIFLLDETEPGCIQALERATGWLHKWLAWFLRRNGVLDGRNLHLLYDRSVSVLGPGALRHPEEIAALAAVAAAHGATFGCELHLADCVTLEGTYREMLEGGRLKSILFNPLGWPADAEPEAGLAVVEAAARSGAALILLGSPGFWERLGVLQSPIVNGANFRIVPGHQPWYDDAAAAPHWTRSAAVSSPCETRFAVYVTPAGDVYPCLGLVGQPRWRMGTVDEDPEQSGFVAAPTLRFLQAWADRGPDLGGDAPAPDAAHLPLVCAVHRRQMEETGHGSHPG